MAFAKGRYSKAISDRSGMEFPYQEMVKEWNGYLVHVSEYEQKHPQLEPKPHGSDPQGLLNARPARTETSVPRLLPLNPFTLANTSATITVFEPDHGRSTADVVRFRNATSIANVTEAVLNLSTGYSITKINNNTYSFTTATTANKSVSGGGTVFAGPVTVEA